MIQRSLFFCFLIITANLTACASPIPVPEEVEEAPTEIIVADESEKVFLPAIQVQENTFPMPEGTPLAEWLSPAGTLFPVMPGTLAGEDIDGSYTFTIAAHILDVQNFYLETLGVQGWVPVSLAESPNSQVIVLQRGDINVKISINFLPDLSLCYVKLGD